MSITPPVAVPLLLLAAVILFASLRPAETASDEVRLTVTMPAEVYRSLQARVEGRFDAESHPLTVERWLADEAQRDAAP
jgi:hypothetical protein